MLGHYLKMAWKVLARRKFYTLVSLFGIAFTLLVLDVCAALADHVFAPGPPETRLGRMLSIERARLTGETSTWTGNPGFGLLDRYARDLPGVERMSIVSGVETVASFLDGRKVESRLRRTDGAFWEIMEFAFLEGAAFTAADDERGNAVAVINETTRRRFFGERPALGRALRADGQRFVVVGVVRDVPITRTLSFAEIWVPHGTSKSTAYRQELLGRHTGILLARDRREFAAIDAELQSRLAAAELPDPGRHHTVLAGARTRYEELSCDILGDGEDFTPRTVRLTLWIGVFTVLFLLLPSLNLVNLNLCRILERAGEIGVRKAFGASSRALVGQFLVEGVVLTLIGGLAGLALSALVLALIRSSDRIPYAALELNYRVFLYGLGLALAFGILSSAYPAWRMSRLAPVEALRKNR
jgi:putative ABC transport system permease protein